MYRLEDFRQAVARGREQRGTEFKGPGSATEKMFLAKVIRAMLGMANKDDGGVVIVGVEETESGLNPRGLSPEQLYTWKYDDLASRVKEYADPYIDFEVTELQVDEHVVVVIEVQGFDALPVICKRSCEEALPQEPGKSKKPPKTILRDGALYVRSRGRRIESVEVPSHVEMREVVEHAAKIVARGIVGTFQDLLETARQTQRPVPSADTEFDHEVEDLK